LRRQAPLAVASRLARATAPIVSPGPALLDQLPVTQVDPGAQLAGMPDAISRRLFKALRLEIRYDRTTHVATCQSA
jgi:hypothetical protein